jgi:hypothetical protein
MARGEDTADPGGAEGHAGRRLATLLGSAALIVALVVIGVVVAVDGGGHDTPATAGSPAPLPAGPAETAVPAGPASTALTTAPASRWELYQGVVLPYSAEHGPKTVQGLGVASGYTHDPTGALLAAVQISIRTALAPDDSWAAVLASQTVDGEGRTAYTAARQGAHIAPNSVPSSSLNQIAGFQVVNYTPAVAVFAVAYRTKTGTVQVGQSTVAWEGGDWKLVLQPNGSGDTAPVAIPSLSGYTLWSGV